MGWYVGTAGKIWFGAFTRWSRLGSPMKAGRAATLLAPERFDRTQPGSPAARHISREEGQENQQQARPREGDRVGGCDTIEHLLRQPRQAKCADHTHPHTSGH